MGTLLVMGGIIAAIVGVIYGIIAVTMFFQNRGNKALK